jgi:O-antigen ligase
MQALDGTLTARSFDRERLARLADALAVAVAVSLPWSTSATSILVPLWLLALLPTLSVAAVRREIATPAGGLPVLLWLLGAVGMLWADASWSERLHGLESFHKLLVIPLLFAQFRQSENGWRVVVGLLISCGGVLALSWVLWLMPQFQWTGGNPRVPVKDYIAQSSFFAICAFVLADMAIREWRERRFGRVLVNSLLALLFIANIAYAALSRTVLVVIPVLLLLLAFKQFRWKGALGALAVGALLAGIMWASSPFLRQRAMDVAIEVNNYVTENALTSSGLRIELWKKSVGFVAEAPLIGHGTGSINELYRRSIVGQTGPAALAGTNPHQQTLTVAVQLGIVGAVLLWAMWIAHLLLFRGREPAAWFGLVIVVQNIVGSLFNSHLFDFTQGWTYVFGVGVAGGMVLRSMGAAPRAAQAVAPH